VPTSGFSPVLSSGIIGEPPAAMALPMHHVQTWRDDCAGVLVAQG